MAIEFRVAPDIAFDPAGKRIAELVRTTDFLTPNLRRADSKALVVSTLQAHRIAILSVADLRNRKRTLSASLTDTWRFFVREGDRPIAGVVTSKDKAGHYQVSQLNEGPLVTGMIKALEHAAALGDKIGGEGFEPILLIVPALNIAALWLTRHGDEADVLLVLEPTYGRFDPYVPMTPAHFLQALRDRNVLNIVSDHRDKGG